MFITILDHEKTNQNDISHLFQLLLRPYEMHSNENYSAIETDFSDTKCVVKGLIDVFIHKLYRLPSSHAIKIYQMLVTFLEMHYARPKIFENYHGARKMVTKIICLNNLETYSKFFVFRFLSVS